MYLLWIKNEVRCFDTKIMIREFLKSRGLQNERIEIYHYTNEKKIKRIK
jgi:hypothetical protein